MNKGAQIVDMLAKYALADGIKVIEMSSRSAPYFDVLDDEMCNEK